MKTDGRYGFQRSMANTASIGTLLRIHSTTARSGGQDVRSGSISASPFSTSSENGAGRASVVRHGSCAIIAAGSAIAGAPGAVSGDNVGRHDHRANGIMKQAYGTMCR